MPLLEARNALVTGGAGGIGDAIVRRFRMEGAIVGSLDRPGQANPSANFSFMHDLGTPFGVEAAITDVRGSLQPLDILVNCAGFSLDTPALEFSSEAFDAVLAVNLRAAVILACRFGADMASRGYGRIVNITSVHGSFGQERCLAYDVSKAGLNQASRSLAVDLAQGGVLVNAVAPGFVDTAASHAGDIAAHETDWFREVYQEHRKLPLGRQAQPAEIAEVVTWLASELNGYVTGHVLTVDGGLTATF